MPGAPIDTTKLRAITTWVGSAIVTRNPYPNVDARITPNAAGPARRPEPKCRWSTTLRFSYFHTSAKYCQAWKKFMMKKASPKLLKPHVQIEQIPVETSSITFCVETW